MTWQVIRLSDAVASPWRNGGGVTRELAAWPAGSADWVWRISVAEVATSGPFSRFADVQRWFAVLSGNGVALQMHGVEHRLTAGSEPLEFDGAVPVDCRLIDGPTQDLNLMVRQGRASARMQRIAGAQQFVGRAAKVLAVYAQAGPAKLRDEQELLTVPEHSLAWRSAPAGTHVEVMAHGAVWMEIEPWA
ncbi:MAG TPA: HutD family protein [Ramlibacter sp.]|nr:HutD family protein [Ramlibacter sp.]